MTCVFRVVSVFVLLITLFSNPSVASAQCQQITGRVFELIEENGRCEIRIVDPDSLRRRSNVVRTGQVIPPISIQAIADEVAARAGSAAVFVQHGPNVASTVTPFPLDRVWSLVEKISISWPKNVSSWLM